MGKIKVPTKVANGVEWVNGKLHFLCSETRTNGYNKWQPKQRFIKDSNDKVLQSDEEVKKQLTKYCSQLYKINRNPRMSVIAELEAITPRQNDDDKIQLSILYSEVELTIKKLKPNKSPGTDGIYSEILQAGGVRPTKQIHRPCCKIWEIETIPEEWSKSIIVILPKKAVLGKCSNYHTLSLINHMSKIFIMVVLNRLTANLEPYLSEEQADFRKDKGRVQKIFILRFPAEKYTSKQDKAIYNCFIDFPKALNSINHEVVWAVLKSYGVNKKLIRIMKPLYNSTAWKVSKYRVFSGLYFPAFSQNTDQKKFCFWTLFSQCNAKTANIRNRWLVPLGKRLSSGWFIFPCNIHHLSGTNHAEYNYADTWFEYL